MYSVARRFCRFKDWIVPAILVALFAPTPAVAQPCASSADETGCLVHNLAIVRNASVAFRELAATRPPAELTSTQREAYDQQTAWLRGAVVELDELARQAASLIGQMELLNEQFLELQDAVQKESSKFQNLSNASKARHEIIMNAIANMKA